MTTPDNLAESRCIASEKKKLILYNLTVLEMSIISTWYLTFSDSNVNVLDVQHHFKYLCSRSACNQRVNTNTKAVALQSVAFELT